TQLILSNAFVNRDKETNKEILFGRVEDESGVIKLIFANVSPYNLLIYNLDNDTLAAIQSLVDYLQKEEVSLRGINANNKICSEFIQCYSEKSGCTFKEYLSMDIMELRELNNSVKLPQGSFRTANCEDMDLLIDWYNNFAKEALNEEVLIEKAKAYLKVKLESNCLYIFEGENQKPMAMAAATRQLTNGVSVSLVYSSKEARGKGYGLAVVYNLSKEYLARGNKFCSLFVDKKNPISNGVYKKLGYKILEDNYDYRIVKEV
ncbi:MAG: GNAT family N-acetyltransferase, partial [Clostridium sp.]